MNRRTMATACSLGVALWAGCGDTDTEAQVERQSPNTTDSMAGTMDPTAGTMDPTDSLADSTVSVVDSTLERGRAMPETWIDEPVEHELRTYPLRIVNEFSADVIMYASAGAGRVVLDTVPALDSVRINVQVRADRVMLEAVDPQGDPLVGAELLLRQDTLNRWVARRPSGETPTGG